MDQLQLDGMPERLYACTPSRLTGWLDCPRRYRMTYLDRPAPPKGAPWAHNSLGASVHNALAAWWRLPPQRRTPDSVEKLVDTWWIGDGFRDDAQAARWRSRAREMVSRYVSELDPDDEPIGVERVVALRTRRLALSGRVDRIDVREGRLVVVDYKTGRRPLTADHARSSLPLAIYALASQGSLRRACRRVELHHVPRGEVAAWDHTDESLGRHLRRAESIAAEAKAADAAFADGLSRDDYDRVFPPRTGPQCAWCDFARHCPEGRQAAPTRRPWDGLDDTEVGRPHDEVTSDGSGHLRPE